MAFFSKVINKVFGSKSEKDLKKLYPFVDKINTEFSSLSNLSDKELRSKFDIIVENLTTLIQNKKNNLVEKNINADKIDEMLYEIEQNYLDESMVEVYAIIKDAARRICKQEYTVMGQQTDWNMVHYDVQLIGGICLHNGQIAEMKTGEGKTLVSTLPIILNAITK